MEDFITYRCTHNCPIKKNCIILKLKEPLTGHLDTIYKCKALKKEIPITIGEPAKPP